LRCGSKTIGRRNDKIVRRLREAFQLALVLRVLEILVWMFAIAELFGL
jgi:hypothetical protein